MKIFQDVLDNNLFDRSSSNCFFKIYKKFSCYHLNEFSMIKPSYYLSEILLKVLDMINLMNRFLCMTEKDYGEAFKIILCIKENAKTLNGLIDNADRPLEFLIQDLEEYFEGEEFDDFEEENENEDIDESIEEELKKADKNHTEKYSIQVKGLNRDEVNEIQYKISKKFTAKLNELEAEKWLVESFSANLSGLYVELVLLYRDILSIMELPENEDIADILSILVDIQFGLSEQVKKLLVEDIYESEEINFEPGLFTYTAHFLNQILSDFQKEKFSEK